MWRFLLFAILCALHGGIPFGHVVLEIICFIDREKIPVLVRLFSVLNELDRLEARRKRLRRLCCFCLRDALLAELELEIEACRSSIARQLLIRKNPERDWTSFCEEELFGDEADLEKLYQQQRALGELDPIESIRGYLVLLQERIEVKERHYLKLLALYRGAPVEVDPTPSNPASSEIAPDCLECVECESVVFAPATSNQW